MRFDTLDAWLAWQESLHPTSIDLGLERVGAVATRLGLDKPAYPVITVAGTNGKGSCVAYLDAIYRHAGYRVGAYTSPHLLHYGERVRVDGVCATDQELCEAFARIDEARGEISLTYFEFGTLAALEVFRRRGIEVGILEVGLGGRFDAVNLVDCDLALISSIGLDHVDWLGPDRESIGREKAGIMRPGRPVVCGDRDLPASVLAHAASVGAPAYRLGDEFEYTRQRREWNWSSELGAWEELPPPSLPGAVQYDNAASVLMAVQLMGERLPVARVSIELGLSSAQVPGRFQRLAGPVETILDVAHNEDSARAFADALREQPVAGRTWAVFALLADKDLEAVGAPFVDWLAGWYVAQLDTPRARPAAALRDDLQAMVPAGTPVEAHSSVMAAYQAARAQAEVGDRIIVFGSFYTVAALLPQTV